MIALQRGIALEAAMFDAIEWHNQIARRFSQAYSSSKLFKERLRVWERHIREHTQVGSRVLDAGCGPALLSLVAASIGARVVGFDASCDMIATARANIAKHSEVSQISLSVARIEDFSQGIEVELFDVVMCSSVLEYVSDLDQCIAALAAQLKPSGKLLVSVPNRSSVYRWLETLSFVMTGRPRYRRFVRNIPSSKSLRQVLVRHGLHQTRSEAFGNAPIVGSLFRLLGLHRFSDVLLIVVAERSGSV